MKIFNNKESFIEAYKRKMVSIYQKEINNSTIDEKYHVLAKLVKENIKPDLIKTQDIIKKQKLKQVYYFSMEFLMGRLLTNNLMNLSIYSIVYEAMKDMGIDLNEIEHHESDIGLGNGGLGRLAACFLDSIATLSYPGNGMCIRYRLGFFQQKFVNGYQVELPERWLDHDFIWETRNDDEFVLVPLYGDVHIIMDNDLIRYKHVNTLKVKAVPYDVPIIGYNSKVINHLTLWSAEPNIPYSLDEGGKDIECDIRQISENLYPDDATKEGKILRLKQQYFLVCAGLGRIITQHKKTYDTLENLHKKVVLHINDTHPTLIIPELMRILIDKEGYTWEKAWYITQRCCAYTNHTIMAEALEKWPINIVQELLPRIYIIIKQIDKWFHLKLTNHFGTNDINKINQLRIVNDNMIHMAHLCIVGSFSVNGVADLHTKLLKEVEMKEFHNIFPKKFNNKTNGITHRRWLNQCNPELSSFLDKYIGKGWITDINRLKRLNKLIIIEQLIYDFYKVKQIRKQKLADIIKKKEGITLDVNSIFDIQVKRLHEYKRQLMNALHILYLYNQLKKDKEFYKNFYPQTFIFGAKAASSYNMAKKIIKLINSIAEIVNQDNEINQKIKVVFVENYNVSYAEFLFPAANISEQISTASKEASGTGNMKFMMNGAITLGTLDGANIEIVNLVGKDNAFIFGLTAEEVNDYIKQKRYCPREIYENDSNIKLVVDQLINGFFKSVKKDEFQMIYEELLNKDSFYILKDFNAYKQAQQSANEAYKNKEKWCKMALKNIANSSYFSSDRTINEYVKDIWHLKKIKD